MILQFCSGYYCLVLNIIDCNNSMGSRHTVELRITVTLLIQPPHN